jgi:hypothetical protein
MGKRRRVGGMAIAAVLLGAGAPHASAADVEVAGFLGGAALTSGGLGYPCTPVGTTTSSNCPVWTSPATPTTVTVTPPVAPSLGCITSLTSGKCVPWTVNGPTRSGTISSTTCIAAAGGNTSKPTKGPWAFGTCSLNAAFTLSGYCGLSSGLGTGNAVLVDAFTGMVNVTLFDFSWESVGTLWVVALQWWKGSQWAKPATPDRGLALMSVSQRVIPPPWTPQTCGSGTQADFDVAGAWLFRPLVVV